LALAVGFVVYLPAFVLYVRATRGRVVETYAEMDRRSKVVSVIMSTVSTILAVLSLYCLWQVTA